MNIFEDSREFARAAAQEPSRDNVFLYERLVKEEFFELGAAMSDYDATTKHSEEELTAIVDIADACIDLIKVTCGVLESLGLRGEALWKEVHRSNMSKVDPSAGVILRRDDGKILKPATYSPPDLESIVREQLGRMRPIGEDHLD